MVPDQKLRYQQLLFLAKKLPDMDDAKQIEENRVPGCLSVVFVDCEQDEAGAITFEGTSDAQLTKGLVALLVNGLSGCTNEQIQGLKPEFIKACGLEQSLTPGRNNVRRAHTLCARGRVLQLTPMTMHVCVQGFLNMLALMKRKAAALNSSEVPEAAVAA